MLSALTCNTLAYRVSFPLYHINKEVWVLHLRKSAFAFSKTDRKCFYSFDFWLKSLSSIAAIRQLTERTKSKQRMAAHLIRSPECNPSFETLWRLCAMVDLHQIFVLFYPVPEFIFSILFCVRLQTAFFSMKFSLCLQMDSLLLYVFFSQLAFWYPSFNRSKWFHFIFFFVECLLWFCYFCVHSR